MILTGYLPNLIGQHGTPTSLIHLQAEEDDSPADPHTPEPESCILFIMKISHYSNIHKVSAVTAYTLRCIHNVHNVASTQIVWTLRIIQRM